MLILPLHRPLSRDNLPWMTLLLLLANVLVFFGWQAGDNARMAAAQQHYLQSGLGELELKAYERHLATLGGGKGTVAMQAVPHDKREQWLAGASIGDMAFQRALQAGSVFDSPEQAKRWRELRTPYDARLQQVFTLRHSLRNSEWSPARMLSSAFLHGDVMHLLGNMLFLLALGTLLEGAVGSFWLLALYVLGALGSSAISVWWRWDDPGLGLGASGAIAALMGAFCVVWGLRQVRFFYWLFVVFDYVRAPALVLLPLWLGWEVLNLTFNAGSNIGFDAHAGGLVCGALLGLLLVLTRQTRPQFMDQAEDATANDDRWQRAQQHIGRMENLQADRLLAELAAEQPNAFDVIKARCIVARNAGNRNALRQRALELLALPAANREHMGVQRELVAEMGATRLPAATGVMLAQRWIELGELRDAEALLAQLVPDVEQRDGLAQSWLLLALQHGDQQHSGERSRVLGVLLERFADLPQAGKARFLLDNA